MNPSLLIRLVLSYILPLYTPLTYVLGAMAAGAGVLLLWARVTGRSLSAMAPPAIRPPVEAMDDAVRRHAVALVVCALVAFALYIRIPAFAALPYWIDSYTYAHVAENLAQGHGFSYTVYNTGDYRGITAQPLYYVLVALAGRVLGDYLLAAQLVTWLSAGLLAGAVYLFVRRLSGSGLAGIAASLYTTLYPDLYYWDLQPSTESLFLLFLTLSLYLLAKSAPGNRHLYWSSAAAVTAFLARFLGLFLFPAILWNAAKQRRSLFFAAAFITPILLLLFFNSFNDDLSLPAYGSAVYAKLMGGAYPPLGGIYRICSKPYATLNRELYRNVGLVSAATGALFGERMLPPAWLPHWVIISGVIGFVLWSRRDATTALSMASFLLFTALFLPFTHNFGRYYLAVQIPLLWAAVYFFYWVVGASFSRFGEGAVEPKLVAAAVALLAVASLTHFVMVARLYQQYQQSIPVDFSQTVMYLLLESPRDAVILASTVFPYDVVGLEREFKEYGRPGAGSVEAVDYVVVDSLFSSKVRAQLSYPAANMSARIYCFADANESLICAPHVPAQAEDPRTGATAPLDCFVVAEMAGDWELNFNVSEEHLVCEGVDNDFLSFSKALRFDRVRAFQRTNRYSFYVYQKNASIAG